MRTRKFWKTFLNVATAYCECESHTMLTMNLRVIFIKVTNFFSCKSTSITPNKEQRHPNETFLFAPSQLLFGSLASLVFCFSGRCCSFTANTFGWICRCGPVVVVGGSANNATTIAICACVSNVPPIPWYQYIYITH